MCIKSLRINVHALISEDRLFQGCFQKYSCLFRSACTYIQMLRACTYIFENYYDIKPTFGECAELAVKALTVNMLEVNCFQIPTVAQPFVSQHKAHIREMVNYFLIDVAQVYRVYMTWELALNAGMGMKRI